MRKKQFLQFRRAMATLLAVAMIGQNTVMTTAENYVADNTACLLYTSTAMGLPAKRQGVLLICLCSSGRPEYQAGVSGVSVLWRRADQM